MPMNFKVFPEKGALDVHFCDAVVEKLDEAIKFRGRATLAVAGGSSPRAFYELLSQQSIAWNCVTITLTDERIIPVTSPESNECLIRKSLLINKAAEAHFEGLWRKSPDGSQDLAISDSMLKAMPTFDVVILGMGTDGHTASLFPASDQLAEAMSEDCQQSIVKVQPKQAPHERLTLSKKRLLDTNAMYLYLVGKDKKITLEKALSGLNELEMPIRAFLKNRKPELNILYSEN